MPALNVVSRMSTTRARISCAEKLGESQLCFIPDSSQSDLYHRYSSRIVPEIAGSQSAARVKGAGLGQRSDCDCLPNLAAFAPLFALPQRRYFLTPVDWTYPEIKGVSARFWTVTFQ